MGSGWRSVLIADGTLRAPWRILLFLALGFVLYFVAGLVALTVADPPGLGKEALFWQAVPLVAALGAGWILLVAVDRRRPGALGFAWTSHTVREIGAGLLIGGGALAIAVGVLAAAGWIRFGPDEGTAGVYVRTLLVDLAAFAIAAAFEEAAFRGYPFQVLVQATGPLAGTLLASAAFAAAHVRNPNVDALGLLNIFLAGVLLSAAYLRTRSLWFATAVHVGWNWAMASLFDLPVSGLAFFDTPLYDVEETGPDWITGGAFGPEGGLAATAAFALAVVTVLRFPGLDEAPEMRELAPLVDRRAAA